MTATIASPQHDTVSRIAPRRSTFNLEEIPEERYMEWSVPDNYRRVVVVIPARDEAADIGDTIDSVWCQTITPHRVIVVANNCTDNGATADAAQQHGAEVLVMDENEHKKAGALNHALDKLLNVLNDHDAVLIMDADTVLESTFIERCLPELKPYVGGVGGRFRGKEDKRGFLPELQRMEFFRYGNEADRLGNRAFVLTGTGTLFSVLALREVKARRGYQLPAGENVYDVFSLTEDNELTIAVNTIGYECIAPGPLTFTDVMPKLTMLWNQRKRWYLGAVRNMWRYGRLMPGHLRWVYWRQQVGLLISSMGAMLYYVVAIACMIMGYSLSFDWIWMIPTAILAVERTITVWPRGWKSRIMAVTVVGELFYTTVLLACFLASFATFASGSKGKWHNT